MGCDIHIFAEYKVGDAPWVADKHHTVNDDDPDYVYVEKMPGGRNYELFGQLAGVRRMGGQNKPKGVPIDISPIVEQAVERWKHDGHSHSYCSLNEFAAALKEVGYRLDPECGDSLSGDYSTNYDRLINHLQKQQLRLKLDIESEKMLLGQDINTEVQVRLVFFFDN